MPDLEGILDAVPGMQPPKPRVVWLNARKPGLGVPETLAGQRYAGNAYFRWRSTSLIPAYQISCRVR